MKRAVHKKIYGTGLTRRGWRGMGGLGRLARPAGIMASGSGQYCEEPGRPSLLLDYVAGSGKPRSQGGSYSFSILSCPKSQSSATSM